jgi:hypothetical protein
MGKVLVYLFPPTEDAELQKFNSDVTYVKLFWYLKNGRETGIVEGSRVWA